MQLPLRVTDWLLRRTDGIRRTAPDVEISRPHAPAYLHRWHLIPRNRVCNVYLHVFLGDDPGDDMHDHPWWSLSLMLRGSLFEHRPDGCVIRATGDVVFRGAATLHRLERMRPVSMRRAKPPVSLFITGPRFRRWGFMTGRGWVDHEAYLREVVDG